MTSAAPDQRRPEIQPALSGGRGSHAAALAETLTRRATVSTSACALPTQWVRAIRSNAEVRRLLCRPVKTQTLNEAAIATIARIADNDVVERGTFGTTAGKTDNNHEYSRLASHERLHRDRIEIWLALNCSSPGDFCLVSTFQCVGCHCQFGHQLFLQNPHSSWAKTESRFIDL